MRVATITDLMNTMTGMFPANFSTPKLVSSWETQYRASLGKLEGDDLNTAWHTCMDGWTKRGAPSPGDLLAAFKRSPKARKSADAELLPLADMLKKRDAERSEDRRNLIERYQNEHAKGYAMALAEGWLGYLEEQVKRSANMIAQRNEMRRTNRPVPDWAPEICDIILTSESSQIAIDKVEKFVPWFSIVTVDGVDLIEIAQQTLKVWRQEAAIPGPARKPIKQTVLQNVGQQPMEVSSAA